MGRSFVDLTAVFPAPSFVADVADRLGSSERSCFAPLLDIVRLLFVISAPSPCPTEASDSVPAAVDRWPSRSVLNSGCISVVMRFTRVSGHDGSNVTDFFHSLVLQAYFKVTFDQKAPTAWTVRDLLLWRGGQSFSSKWKTSPIITSSRLQMPRIFGTGT